MEEIILQFLGTISTLCDSFKNAGANIHFTCQRECHVLASALGVHLSS